MPVRREASKWRTELVLWQKIQMSRESLHVGSASTDPFSRLSIDLVMAATQSCISRSVVAW